jgi:hypothetical protein
MIVELACGCNKKVLASYRDAGGEVTCDCGRKVEVPRLSELRKLARDESRPAPSLALSQRQLIGRYILGTMFAIWMLGTLYTIMTNNDRGYSIFTGMVPLGLSAALMMFTVLGRIWARLIIIVLVIWSMIPIVIAYQSSHRPEHLGAIAMGGLMILALMFIKT